MSEEIQQIPDATKKRRTVLVGIGILSALSFLSFGLFKKRKDIISCAPPAVNGTMKMLTEDGRLVEVDIANLGSLKKKLTDKELQEWVKR